MTETTPPHAASPAALFAQLGSGRQGLSAREAAARRARFGPNELPERAVRSLFVIYLSQFRSPFIYLLLAAAAVSLGFGKVTDALFILGVLCFNAAIGAFQESRAESRARALRALVASWVTVWRDGAAQRLDGREIVPGDVVQVETGLRIPADIRLFESRDLKVDESLLTGESVPVGKDAGATAAADAPLGDRTTMLHAGSTVVGGRASGIVVATAASTEVGRIAARIAAAPPSPPPLIRRMERFTRALAIAMVGVVALLGGVEWMRGAGLAEVFLIAVALAVSAIPEGLPVAMTVALSISVSRMGKRNVVVRNLPAVEGLGSCTLIASDKTGTLTLNELTVATLWLPGIGRCAAADPRAAALARAGALCNEATLGPDGSRTDAAGDTVDIAFLAFAAMHGEDLAALRARVLSRIPYEPELRFAAAFHGHEGAIAAALKGAPETILPMCQPSEHAADEAAALAASGYRVIAIAEGPVDEPTLDSLHGLRLLGLAGIMDPVRPEAPDAVARAHRAGIDVRMITGDHPLTARTIARTLGIADDGATVATGADLAAATPDRFEALVRDSRVFARIEPLQKLRIVETLRAQGHIVAVTGDGINDAAALHAADIGVAMGRGGTDVAREAADLIVVDDNFASIVAGIEEGRIAYDNVRKVIQVVVATGAAEILIFVLATAFGLPTPLTAVQLLWLNLVTNGIQDVAIACERGEPGRLEQKPRPPGQPIFDRLMTTQVLLAGGYIGAVSFAVYAWMLDAGFGIAAAQNALLWLIVCFENAHCFNSRSERRSVFAIPLRANPVLVFGVLATQGLQIAAPFVPGLQGVLGVEVLSLAEWLALAAIALTVIPLMEAFKRLWR